MLSHLPCYFRDFKLDRTGDWNDPQNFVCGGWTCKSGACGRGEKGETCCSGLERWSPCAASCWWLESSWKKSSGLVLCRYWHVAGRRQAAGVGEPVLWPRMNVLLVFVTEQQKSPLQGLFSSKVILLILGTLIPNEQCILFFSLVTRWGGNTQ